MTQITLEGETCPHCEGFGGPNPRYMQEGEHPGPCCVCAGAGLFPAFLRVELAGGTFDLPFLDPEDAPAALAEYLCHWSVLDVLVLGMQIERARQLHAKAAYHTTHGDR